MGGGEWAQFVLPDAPVSTVEGGSGEVGIGEDRRGRSAGGEDGEHVEEEGEEEEEEEEEEDIEIVMDREVTGQRWMGPSSS
jgi:la-related protein 1